MKVIHLSGIYAAIAREADGTTVTCTGIALFNEEGRISGEIKGGKLVWRTSSQGDIEIKNRILERVQGDPKRTGIVHHVPQGRIFLVDRKTYTRMVKAGNARYERWLGTRKSR